MKIKQRISKQSMGQRESQKETFKNILRKMKWKHNMPKLIDATKAVLKWEVYRDKCLN